ncbi:MAG: hypothetical protein EA399_10935 [Desulfovibrionales bacterium]|nr:MAG: hypothetical protein EA399_10935 [Desulfovibrionales bacterium]
MTGLAENFLQWHLRIRIILQNPHARVRCQVCTAKYSLLRIPAFFQNVNESSSPSTSFRNFSRSPVMA